MPLYQNDIGVALVAELRVTGTKPGVADVAYDLTDVVSVTVLIRKPSGTTVSKTGTVYNARKGEVRYVTVSGDLDQVGTYTWQAQVVPAAGQVLHSAMDTFQVLTPLTVSS